MSEIKRQGPIYKEFLTRDGKVKKILVCDGCKHLSIKPDDGMLHFDLEHTGLFIQCQKPNVGLLQVIVFSPKFLGKDKSEFIVPAPDWCYLKPANASEGD